MKNLRVLYASNAAQKMKFFIKDFFSNGVVSRKAIKRSNFLQNNVIVEFKQIFMLYQTITNSK